MSSAQKQWELENAISPLSAAQNALYNYDAAADKTSSSDRRWTKNPRYFRTIRISALALLKMTMHARSGGTLEIMGLMTGYTSGSSIIVTDAFRLPVQGTETRVNAQAEAEEYMVNYMSLSREGGGRLENAVGWYHSHPGYGCWLSGIDVETQRNHQQHNDPFVAVVVDPNRTVSAGKVDIGAFRTFPKDYDRKAAGAKGGAEVDEDGFQVIPAGKVEDFGAHAGAYYALEVRHFKSELDERLLGRLWNKYWVKTLAQSPLYVNRGFVERRVADQAVKVEQVERKVKTLGGFGAAKGEIVGVERGQVRLVREEKMEALVKGGEWVAGEERAGLAAGRVKERLFVGVVDEARRLGEMQGGLGQVVNGEGLDGDGDEVLQDG